MRINTTRALSLADLDLSTVELVEEYGFRNRWTAKIYQWYLAYSDGATVALEPTPDNVAMLADDVREWLTDYKNVPEDRQWGVDFEHIALVLCGTECGVEV